LDIFQAEHAVEKVLAGANNTAITDQIQTRAPVYAIQAGGFKINCAVCVVNMQAAFDNGSLARESNGLIHALGIQRTRLPLAAW